MTTQEVPCLPERCNLGDGPCRLCDNGAAFCEACLVHGKQVPATVMFDRVIPLCAACKAADDAEDLAAKNARAKAAGKLSYDENRVRL